MILFVAKARDIPIAQAKKEIDEGNAIVGKGDDIFAAKLLDDLHTLGAIAEYQYEFSDEELRSRAEDVTTDGSTCRFCGCPLFWVAPGYTTPDEINSFVASSNWTWDEDPSLVDWLHPGVYCKNYCGPVTVNLGAPEKFQRYRN